MTWQTIVPLPRNQSSRLQCPPDGLCVVSRGFRQRGRAEKHYYSVIRVGAKLGNALGFQHQQPVRLMRGKDQDDCKLAIVVDPQGKFIAKRVSAIGEWHITIAVADTAALLNMPLEPIVQRSVEAIRGENGQPPMCAVKIDAKLWSKAA